VGLKLRWAWAALALTLVGALAVFGAACGDDDGGDDEAAAEVEALIRAVADAWNGKDVDAFLAAVTDQFLSDEFELASREEAAEALSDFGGDPPITLGEFSNTQVSADTATTEANFFFAKGVLRTSSPLSERKTSGSSMLRSRSPARSPRT